LGIKMAKLFYTFIIVLILQSCYNINKSESVTPEILLSKSQLVEILTEIQIIEANFRISKNRSKASKLKPTYYDKILKENGITLKQLKDNMDYYHNSPVVMEEIYELVLGNLSKIQSEALIEKEELEKAIVADSIAKLNDSLELIRIDSLARLIK